MKADGVAALGIWPVTVSVAGHAYTIPPTPAVKWMFAISQRDWLGIIPGFLPGLVETIDDMIIDGVVSAQDCERAAKDALAAATGMPWWSAAKLINSALASPGITGAMVLAGIRFDEVGIGAVTHAAYRLYTKNADAKQLARIDREIEQPPREMSIAERASMRGSGFEQMMAQRGGVV